MRIMDIDLNLSSPLEENDDRSIESCSEGRGGEYNEEPADKSRLTEEINALEQLLSVGSNIDTIEAVYALYCDYARLLVFSVKKGTQSYFTNSLIIRMKVFYCSCEGLSDERRSDSLLLKYRKSIIRCNCRARLRVIRDAEGQPWTVSIFVKEHNHELLRPDYSYLLRSARNLTLAQRSMLEVFHSRGIGVSKAFAFMEKEARGVQNVGFLP